MHALHVGPGKLGLGLVATHLITRARVPLYLVGRPGEQRQFYVTMVPTGPEGRPLEATHAGGPASVAELQAEVRGWVTGEAPLLITAALGDHAPSCAALLADVVGRRPATAETLLVACENKDYPVYRALADAHRHLTFAPAVVDRICIHPGDEGRAPDGLRQVAAHEVWEWVVELRDGRTPLLREALEASGVVVTGVLAPHKRRKLWFVNGLHQVLALYARYLGVEPLPTAAAHPDYRPVAAELVGALRDTIRLECPGLDTPQSYVDDRIRAFAEMEDYARRILREHLVRDNMLSLIERLDERVFAAAEAARAHGVSTDPFLAVVDVLIRLAADRTKFYAPKEPKEPVADEVVVAAFAASLCRWLDDRAVARHAERLAHALQASA